MRLITALGLFTVVPMPAREVDRPAAFRAMAALPLVGLLLGGAAGVVAWAGASLGAPWVGAALALALLAGLTGGLHLDGLADTADGLGSRKDPDRALGIMKRSDIGPMGVISLVVVLLVQFAAIVDITARLPLAGGIAVALAACGGRVAVQLCARGGTARPGGFGALFAGTPTLPALVLNLLAVVTLAGLAGWWLQGVAGAASWVLAVGVALAVGWVWQRHLVARLGGSTGDVFGSVIEVTQATALVALVVAVHLVA